MNLNVIWGISDHNTVAAELPGRPSKGKYHEQGFGFDRRWVAGYGLRKEEKSTKNPRVLRVGFHEPRWLRDGRRRHLQR